MGAAVSPGARPRPWWAARGLRFECARCGRCCRGEPGAVFLLPDEEAALGAFFGLSPGEFRARYETSRWRYPSLRERAGGECVMLGADGGCLVYDLRPLMCRTWPFWPEALDSPGAWERAARRCPGMDAGRLRPADEIARALERHLAYGRALEDRRRKEEQAWRRASGSF